MIYMTNSSKDIKPNRMIVVPYLHERRVYLEKTDNNNEYFNTSAEYQDQDNKCIHDLIRINITKDNLSIFAEGGQLKKKIYYKKIVQEFGQPLAVSGNGRAFVFMVPDTAAFSVMGLNYNGFFLIKTLDIETVINHYYKEDPNFFDQLYSTNLHSIFFESNTYGKN